MVLVGVLEGGEGRDFAEEGEGRRTAHAFETLCHTRVLSRGCRRHVLLKHWDL